ncbi:MAG TPA: efflux RND transporter periplasmic adaptor subunit [Caulobacteraceae bacterium]|nr:efflux RND transporter periplasmic adaptor subunit [Caulobacteraceae bacterium]
MVVKTEPVTLSTELPGRTSPYQTSDVRPQINGIIKSRLFKEGGDVRLGQSLYQIDPAPYRAAYDQAKAQLAGAEANLVTTQAKAQRYAELVKINGVARQDYDDAEAAYRQAVASVSQYKAAVEAAKINLDYTNVTAPISGRIGRALYTPGALVQAGQTNVLATIQDLDPIYVDLTQSADELLRLEREMAGGSLQAGPGTARVRLMTQDGTPFAQEGTLKFSEVTVDPSTGFVVLRAEFPNPKRVLLPGLFVRAVIDEGVQPDAVLAPQRAVTHNEKGQPTAFVIGADGKAELRTLETSRAVGTKWVVTKGLSPGDKLIVDGLINVQPGIAVKAVPAGPPPPAVAVQ